MATVRLQSRRDTLANWTTHNPILGSGEHGFETDTGYERIGDGSTAFLSLGRRHGAYIHYDDYAAFKASTEGSRGVGAIWRYGPFSGEEVASGGDVTNSATSPVRLEVLATAGIIFVDALGADNTGVDDIGVILVSAANRAAALKVETGFFGGTYNFETQAALPSNTALVSRGFSIVNVNNSLSTPAIYATGKTKISIKGIVFIGSGTPTASGTERLVQLESCSDISISDNFFSQSRNTAVVLDNCSNIDISGNSFQSNHIYGCEIRNDSSDFRVRGNSFTNNGNSTGGSSALGRGLVLWRSEMGSVSDNSFVDNTEYGLRLYSQTGDATPHCNTIAITANSFDNNGTTATGKSDLYLYNESGGINNVSISGNSLRTRADNYGISAQGSNITISGNTLKALSAQSGIGIVFFGISDSTVVGNTISEFSAAFSYSGSVGEEPNRVNVASNSILGCAAFAPAIYGDNNIIQGNYIQHGGVGVSDLAFFADKATSSGTRIIGNTFDGWYRAFQLNLAVTDTEVVDNSFINITNTDARIFGTALTNLKIHGNKFDIGINPAELTFTDTSGVRATGFKNAAPTTLTYQIGDQFMNYAATAGGTIGWVCVVAGTPGTWKTFGAITA